MSIAPGVKRFVIAIKGNSQLERYNQNEVDLQIGAAIAKTLIF